MLLLARATTFTMDLAQLVQIGKREGVRETG